MSKELIIKILKRFAVILVGLSSIVAAYYAYKGFDLQQSQIVKESTPFFKYRYSEDVESFMVESEEEANIHSIQWFFPFSEKEFDGFLKNSNSLTVDEIISRVWSALIARKIPIPPPSPSTNTYGYIRCNVLAVFDGYYSVMESDAGFLMGTLIEYTRKGENLSYFSDIVLIRDFDTSVPQIRIVKAGATEDDIKTYMRKGAERLDNILPIYPYNQNEAYVENNKCNRTSTSWTRYFFDEADKEKFLQPFKEDE